MNPDLPEPQFADPFWHALHGPHHRLRVSLGDACRYPADVAPFAAVSRRDPSTLRELCELLAPGESVWTVGDYYPEIADLETAETLKGFQMVLPETATVPALTATPELLSAQDAVEMVALTDLAFPGFFRIRTCEMGAYYGFRSAGGELVAMGGERLLLEGYVEISGLCVHPEHRGNRYAANLIAQLVRNHRRDGLVSWLHVGSENHTAIALYRRLEFQIVRQVTFNRIRRR